MSWTPPRHRDLPDDLRYLLTSEPPGMWIDDGACRGHDPDMFMPARGANTQTLATVRNICAGCPVRDECAAYADTVPWIIGVWGGATQAERRAKRRLLCGWCGHPSPGAARCDGCTKWADEMERQWNLQTYRRAA